jgi:hypothetical protein
MEGTPYLQVEDAKRMLGKGAPRRTVFGPIGRTKAADPYMRSLGGLLIETTKGGKSEKPVMSEKAAVRALGNTEHHILGKASKTEVPGAHFGQVPYPGKFRSVEGSMVSH